MRLSALTRVFFVFTFLLGCFLLFKPAVFAQTLNQTPQSQSIQQSMYSDTNPNVPKNLHTFTQNVMIEVMSAMICQISGIDPINGSQGCLGIDPQTKKIGFVKNGGGLIGVLSNSIATLYTPPLHTSDYLKYMAANFGIAKNTYAASNDLGYNSITPLAGVWLVARNVAYLFFVILFLIIGIGIMLRIHIDPRTVMTIQNQIPKIIIAIVLVTFSFAIAGLLIDLMYIISYLLLGIISSGDPVLMKISPDMALNLVRSTNPLDAANMVTSGNSVCTSGFDLTKLVPEFQNGCLPLSGLADLAAQPAGLVTGMVGNMFNSPVGHTITGVLGAIIGGLLAKTVGAPAAGLAGVIAAVVAIGAIAATGGAALPIVLTTAAAVGGLTTNVTSMIMSGAGAAVGYLAGDTLVAYVAGIITFLIVLIAILVTLFRLWFQLIMAYISVLLNIVFAPIWIMLGLIPGSKINFSAWIRNLIGNLSCFPTALVMFLMARVFIDAFINSGTNLFVAPLVGNPSDTKGLAAIIGMGIFLMAPSAVTQVKNALSGGSGISFGGIGQSLSAGAAVPMAGIKGVAATRMKTPMPGEAAGWRGLARLWGMG